MPAKYKGKVVLNRAVLDAVTLGAADGALAFAERVVAAAKPPDAPPYGEGLVQGGGAIGFVGRKKIGGTTIGGKAIKKPSTLKLNDFEVCAIGGFGFPAMFIELGTLRAPARPFLSKALAEIAPEAYIELSAAIKRRMAGIRDTTVSDRIAAARAKKADRLAARDAPSAALMDALRATATEQGY